MIARPRVASHAAITPFLTVWLRRFTVLPCQSFVTYSAFASDYGRATDCRRPNIRFSKKRSKKGHAVTVANASNHCQSAGLGWEILYTWRVNRYTAFELYDLKSGLEASNLDQSRSSVFSTENPYWRILLNRVLRLIPSDSAVCLSRAYSNKLTVDSGNRP